jgi:hypothetical protein
MSEDLHLTRLDSTRKWVRTIIPRLRYDEAGNQVETRQVVRAQILEIYAEMGRTMFPDRPGLWPLQEERILAVLDEELDREWPEEIEFTAGPGGEA